jgi:SagB-type dehydrogenase family enzyme
MENTVDAPTTDSALRVFELFHENSKQRQFDLEFGRRILLLNGNLAFHEVVSRTFKSYPGAEFILLPAVVPAEGPSFERVAATRRSIRRFDGQPLSLRELALLLYFGAGVTGRLDPSEHGIVQPVRAAPSGGALYPIEVYAAVMAVEGLEPGLYHYAVDRKGLELLRRANMVEHLCEATFDPATILGAAVVFVLTGVFGRSYFKYGERGYRFAMLEAGHMCQNVLLEATALQIGAVAVGGFLDDKINEMIGLDGVDEAATYLIAAGRAATRHGAIAGSSEQIVDRLLSALWARATPIAGG